MAENNFSNTLSTMFQSMNGFLSTKTVVGDATKVGDNILIPLVDVSFGAGAGANAKDSGKGGVGGIHGKMSPSAVLMIKPDGTTKLINVKNQDTITKILDMVPDVLDKFTKKKDDDITDEEAVDAAFPEEKK